MPPCDKALVLDPSSDSPLVDAVPVDRKLALRAKRWSSSLSLGGAVRRLDSCVWTSMPDCSSSDTLSDIDSDGGDGASEPAWLPAG